MSDNAAVFPYQSPPLGNSVSWGKLRISSTVEHIRKMSSSPLGNILFFGLGISTQMIPGTIQILS